jgi:hypothetical protein
VNEIIKKELPSCFCWSFGALCCCLCCSFLCLDRVHYSTEELVIEVLKKENEENYVNYGIEWNLCKIKDKGFFPNDNFWLEISINPNQISNYTNKDIINMKNQLFLLENTIEKKDLQIEGLQSKNKNKKR